MSYPDLNSTFYAASLAPSWSGQTQVLYTQAQAATDYFNTVNPGTGKTVFMQIVADANAVYPTNTPAPGPSTPWPLVYGNSSFAMQLDSMSLEAYINSLTSFLRQDRNGAKTSLAQLLKVGYVCQYGADVTAQSPLNMLFLNGFQLMDDGVSIISAFPDPGNTTPVPPSLFEIYGISDERYHVPGGNDLVVSKLVANLTAGGTLLRSGYRLVAVTQRSDLPKRDKAGNVPYTLTFTSPSGAIFSDTCAHAVLALPFSVMANSSDPRWAGLGINLAQAGFSSLKLYAINALRMGKNTKHAMLFQNRFWRQQNNSGYNLATTNPWVGFSRVEAQFQCSWESTRAQPGVTGGIVQYASGVSSDSFHTTAAQPNVSIASYYGQSATNAFTAQWSFLTPGAGNSTNFAFNVSSSGALSNVVTDNWSENPYTRGSYSYWLSGQYVGNGSLAFAGYEGVPEPYNVNQTGNCHFAGEHTSFDNQGYLDGAVESGNRVAAEIVASLAAFQLASSAAASVRLGVLHFVPTMAIAFVVALL